MRIAFSHWESRIAPVFDVAKHLYLLDVDGASDSTFTEAEISSEDPYEKVKALTEFSVDVLVCGAISRSLQNMIEAAGIEIYSFVAGDLQQVVTAWQENRLQEQNFSMPGCYGRGRGCGTAFQGAGRGRRRRKQAMGSDDRRRNAGAGTGGFCICPKCANKEAHIRGIPCAMLNCSKCGTAMMRE